VVKHIHFLFATAEQSQNLLQMQKAHLKATVFFFAMQPCEFSKVPDPGLTKLTQASDVTFYKYEHQIIVDESWHNMITSSYVSVTFATRRMEIMQSHTHQRSPDNVLCPV
jgi:hypothetical protein